MPSEVEASSEQPPCGHFLRGRSMDPSLRSG